MQDTTGTEKWRADLDRMIAHINGLEQGLLFIDI